MYISNYLSYLSSFDNLFSLGAGLDAVLAFEITVAGLAIVKITSDPVLPFSWPLAGNTVNAFPLPPHKFSLDLHLLCISSILLLLLFILFGF